MSEVEKAVDQQSEAPPELTPGPDEAERRAEAELAKLRKRARTWASMCSGLGFGLLGRPTAAVVGQLLMLAAAGAIIVASTLAVAAAWQALAVLVVALVIFWLIEVQSVRRMTPRASGQAIAAVRWPLLIVQMLAVGAALTCILVFTRAGTVDSGAMRPTLEPGERFLYRRVAGGGNLKAGEIILFMPQGRTRYRGILIVSRILAAPGDIIQSRDGRYVVNDKTAARISMVREADVALAAPGPGKTVPVPKDCYWVVPDDPTAYDSQVFGWVRSDEIVGDRPIPLRSLIPWQK